MRCVFALGELSVGDLQPKMHRKTLFALATDANAHTRLWNFTFIFNISTFRLKRTFSAKRSFVELNLFT